MADSKKMAPKDKVTAPSASKTDRKKVSMVAIGASAGGLEPFERFFDAMPVNSDIAFVIIQHLSPDFESMMDELLSRHSSMDIERVVNELRVKPKVLCSFKRQPVRNLTVCRDLSLKAEILTLWQRRLKCLR